jgi:ribosomal protein L16 Arg81 hydroxylase
MTFDEAIEPLTVPEFVARHLGTRYLLAKPGVPRFRGLVQWDEVNQALRHVRFSPQRLRLVQNGKTIPASAFTFVDDDASGGSSLDGRRFERFLANGATLSINKVDELFPEVQTFAESCENQFRIPVGVNLYAGWRTDNGFDLHWDRHDTLILQISGRKHWTVYEPTVDHPLEDRLLTPPPTPTGAPIWEGLLEEGDLLYMPRGWWHVARPLDEPTLHLTAGLRHRTAATLLKWIGAELNKQTAFRMDLPVNGSRDEQAAYAATVRDLVTAALTDDVVEQYMRMVDHEIPARPRVHLPDAAMSKPVRLEPDTPLRLASGHQLHIDPPREGRTVTFAAGGSDWSCDLALVSALRLLRGGRPTTMKEMGAAVEPMYKLPLRMFVETMLARQVIWAERPRKDEVVAATPQSAKASWR